MSASIPASLPTSMPTFMPPANPALRHGGRILVDQLRLNGVARVFCIPGESFLAALDGLFDSGIETIVGRQEGGVAMMAEADGKLTGRPGIAFVTRGPGATNASAGIHVAFQDSTPMILFIGQVASDQRDREAFQEVDYRAMFAPLAKWVAEIDRTERIPEYVSRAFHVAMSGRPGPIVLALPEDMLSGEARVADALPAAPVRNGPSSAEVAAIRERLKAARRPMAIVGGGGWSAQAAEDLVRFAAAHDLPVGTSFRCQDYLDNAHPSYVGDIGIAPNPKLAARVREADLLLVIGARLGEMTTSGYTLLGIPNPRQELIHVYPDASELGRVYRPDLGIVSASPEMLRALATLPGLDAPAWARKRAGARAEYEAWRVPHESPGALKMERVVAHLSDVLPAGSVVTNGAGNYAGWLHRYFTYASGPRAGRASDDGPVSDAGPWRSQLAPTSGSMGYGLPAAIAAKLRMPGREVVCLAGDGCFQMTMNEFGTAYQYGANVIVLVVDNGLYGTIRMHQERHYPGRVSGTALTNPDFAALARSYGAHGETVTEDAAFPDALARARGVGTPSLLHLKVDPRALSPRLTLDNP